jgi:cation diffusion facilitator CzcD-associated flavoprotein CzcO
VRRWVRAGLVKQLPPDVDVDVHFNPRYNPWDQRVCLDPDGELFAALREGTASVVTDSIERFTENGLLLGSGEELEADLVITATGLNLLPAGGIELEVDGRPVDLSETVGYKGMMFSGVPNLALALGYTNASWTLKCDLVAHYVCRLLNHMRDHDYEIATPQPPDPREATEPFIDLKAGYVLRSIERMPRQGARRPWRLHQNYPLDIYELKHGPLTDEGIQFSRPRQAPAAEPLAAASA